MNETNAFLRGVEAGMKGNQYHNPYNNPKKAKQWEDGFRVGRAEYLDSQRDY